MDVLCVAKHIQLIVQMDTYIAFSWGWGEKEMNRSYNAKSILGVCK